MKKTNALRILDAKKIPYTLHPYDATDGSVDGISVAAKIGIEPGRVFKTLVTRGSSGAYCVFVVPVQQELNLKKGAAAAGEKRVELIPVKDLQPVTGYIRGGCSPVGMKKPFRTFVEETAELENTIVVSAGQIGLQMELPLTALLTAASAETADIV